jgi:hypothetical protein
MQHACEHAVQEFLQNLEDVVDKQSSAIECDVTHKAAAGAGALNTAAGEISSLQCQHIISNELCMLCASRGRDNYYRVMAVCRASALYTIPKVSSIAYTPVMLQAQSTFDPGMNATCRKCIIMQCCKQA